jgi:hypothetical protein
MVTQQKKGMMGMTVAKTNRINHPQTNNNLQLVNENRGERQKPCRGGSQNA